jgi:hypothetical protein
LANSKIVQPAFPENTLLVDKASTTVQVHPNAPIQVKANAVQTLAPKKIKQVSKGLVIKKK